MAKHSRFERGQRAAETERLKEITSAWARSVTPEVAKAFALGVEAARARGPEQPKPDMAPGTPPNPPRPGHEPRAPKAAPRSRRSY